MENASKALVIAGAILISIILVSLGIVVINQVKSQISDSSLTSEEVQAFNSKFDTYLGTIDGTTANALVSLCNANGVTVTVTGSASSANKGSASYPSFDKGATITASIKTVDNGSTNSEDKGKITEIELK